MATKEWCKFQLFYYQIFPSQVIQDSELRVCDFSSHDISPHETFTLHPNPNHNPNPNPNANPNPSPNSIVAVTCLKIKWREMNCFDMNCPVPRFNAPFSHAGMNGKHLCLQAYTVHSGIK